MTPRGLIGFAIRYPVTVIVGVLLIALFGIVSLLRIPVQLTPNVERPEITVETFWPGASPQEVEREILIPQEDQLKHVEGLERMISSSSYGRGEIVLRFPVGTDLSAALVKVANRLHQVRDYPPDVEEPVIYSVGLRANAIAWFILHDRRGGRDITAFRDLAEEVIKPRLERVPGVAAANVFGGRDRQLQVIVDPVRLAAREITLPQLARSLAQEGLNVSAGSLPEGKRRYLVRGLGEYTSPEAVSQVVVAMREGRPVRVGDVAEVRLALDKPRTLVRQMGEPAIAINAQRAIGANVLQTMKGLREAVVELNREVLAPQGLELIQVYDETDYIYRSLSLVERNLLVGALLAVGVLFLFLRSPSTTLVVAVAIPISVVGTFLILHLLGRNLNVISLAGMTFAAGLVVDNAIVVLENIYRHREMGKTRWQAAFDGTREVWGALVASTLTTMAVFIPVLFVKEQPGQLFRDIALAISGGVGLSLLVAITVIPSLAARVIREEAASRKQWGIGWARRFRDGIVALNAWVGERAWRQVALVVLLTGVSLGGAWALLPKVEYLPEGNRNLIFGMLLPPPGYSLEELSRMGHQVEEALRPLWKAPGTTPVTAGDGAVASGPPKIVDFFYVVAGDRVFLGAKSEDPDRVRELIPLVHRALSDLPGTFAIVTQPSLFERGIAAGRSIEVEIRGSDLPTLVGLGGRMFGEIRRALPGAQIRPIPSLDLGTPQVHVVPDRDRVAQVGFTQQELGLIVQTLVDGAIVGEYLHQGDRIDLVLRVPEGLVTHLQDLSRLPLYTPVGRPVSLDALAQVSLVSGPERIQRIERQRAIVLQVIPPEETPLQAAMERIQKQVLDPLRANLPPGVSLHLSGTVDLLTQTYEAFRWNFALAVLITFLLLASLFESFVYPVVILVSVPLAAVGGFLGLRLVNLLVAPQPLDMLTMLGFVILIGIVVNNAILIVHQGLRYLRERGWSPGEAVQEAVRVRVRPIFMSVLTTVFGLVPLVVTPGAGSELYRGVGSVVLGGLLVSTLFTLFVVPALFRLLLGVRYQWAPQPAPVSPKPLEWEQTPGDPRP